MAPPGIGGRGKHAEVRQVLPIEHQRLSEFRKLADVPLHAFKERIESLKQREEKISYNNLLRGDWYQMSESIEWETPQWLFDLLDQEYAKLKKRGMWDE